MKKICSLFFLMFIFLLEGCSFVVSSEPELEGVPFKTILFVSSLICFGLAIYFVAATFGTTKKKGEEDFRDRIERQWYAIGIIAAIAVLLMF